MGKWSKVYIVVTNINIRFYSQLPSDVRSLEANFGKDLMYTIPLLGATLQTYKKSSESKKLHLFGIRNYFKLMFISS